MNSQTRVVVVGAWDQPEGGAGLGARCLRGETLRSGASMSRPGVRAREAERVATILVEVLRQQCFGPDTRGCCSFKGALAEEKDVV